NGCRLSCLAALPAPNPAADWLRKERVFCLSVLSIFSVCLSSPAPKLVFNRVNGKRPPAVTQHMSATEECYTSAHEENVRFVYEAWQQIEQQLDDSQNGETSCSPVQYVEITPNPGLKNFVPIDLEEWWAQQFLAKIENGS
ncbi:MAPK regulated corepressor interacting protein 2, partial [Alligator sinensis]|uniref:MAPK regulated corepressor interacting protein 2 n=1 Tax=Alligator sinensis TaxID=38654 RepID=A0A1U8DL61_ALLSI